MINRIGIVSAPLPPAGVTSAMARGQHGVTLIELLMVVAVAAVLAAIAVPNMGVFMKNNARSTRLNDLSTVINYTRSNAVTQGSQFLFCAGNAAGTACSGDARYERNVLVMRANIANPADPFVAGEWTRDRTFEGTDSTKIRITGDVNYVVFLPSGMAQRLVANRKFVHCDDRGATSARAVVLTPTGHPVISSDADGNGIHEVNGTSLTCPAL